MRLWSASRLQACRFKLPEIFKNFAGKLKTNRLKLPTKGIPPRPPQRGGRGLTPSDSGGGAPRTPPTPACGCLLAPVLRSRGCAAAPLSRSAGVAEATGCGCFSRQLFRSQKEYPPVPPSTGGVRPARRHGSRSDATNPRTFRVRKVAGFCASIRHNPVCAGCRRRHVGDLAGTQFTPRDGIDYRRLRRLHATGRTDWGEPVPPLPPRWGGVHPNPRPLPPGEGEERRTPPVPPLGGFHASRGAVRRLRRRRFTAEGTTSSVVPPTLDGWPSGDIPYLACRVWTAGSSGVVPSWRGVSLVA